MVLGLGRVVCVLTDCEARIVAVGLRCGSSC